MIINTDRDFLVRDMTSKALINTDKESLIKRKKERNNVLKLKKLEDDIIVVKSDLEEIKMLLKEYFLKG